MSPRRLLDTLYDGAAYLAAAFVFAIFAIMIVSSLMREAGMRTGGTDDIVAWFCAAAGFLAMAHTFRHGDFVRVVLLLDRLGERQARRFEILALVIGSLFVAFLAWAALLFVHESWDFGDMANGLVPIPLWIPQSSFVLGTLLLLAAIIEELISVLRGHRPSYVVAMEERHARGDFSEDI